MARRPKAMVLDSWAALAYLGGESSAQEVADLITGAHESGVPMYMSIINAGEVWYILARAFSEAKANEALTDLTGLGIELIDADWLLTQLAGTFKARHKMSYADCFAAALAKDRKAGLVTGDKEFRQVEGEVDVRWL